MNNIAHTLKKTDTFLITICFILSVISVFLIYLIYNSFAISQRLIIVQIISSCLGLLIALIISSIDYHLIVKFWKFYVPVCIFLVILTFFIGSQRGNADDKAWITLPFGMSFQPAEFLKIAFILSFSSHLNHVVNKINQFKNIIFLTIHGVIPVLLTHLQGDDGTALMFVVIFLTMFFSAGISWKYIFFATFALLFTSPFVWYIMNQDQKRRILITLHPETDPSGIGYQQFNGLISIGTGGFFGKWFSKKAYRFVPEIQNDFIFSFIGQAFGYIGCFIIIILLMCLAFKILFTSLKSEDYLGQFICIGVFGMIFSQIIFNIGMNLSVLPVIGITLPLLSAGGSSIITIYAGIGLTLSVFTFNNKSLFYS